MYPLLLPPSSPALALPTAVKRDCFSREPPEALCNKTTLLQIATTGDEVFAMDSQNCDRFLPRRQVESLERVGERLDEDVQVELSNCLVNYFYARESRLMNLNVSKSH